MKFVFLVTTGIFLFFSVRLYAQEKENETLILSEESVSVTDSLQTVSNVEWEPCISPFIELLGKGFLSFNVDFRRKENYSFSIGLQAMEGFTPSIMYYHFGGERKRLEIGGGISTGFNNKFQLAGLLFHGVAGYRYQRKKGVFFRVGFTPFYVIIFDDKERSNKIFPFPGISLGHSF